jgi:predicted GIY-YIG superfamily endonuclease
VLKSNDGLYYVGKSTNIEARLRQHRSDGVAFTKTMDAFQRIQPLTNGSTTDLESWERNETLQRMHRHGIDNVRGWMFTTVELSDEQRMDAFKQVCEKFDLCRTCGRGSHFVANCFANTKATWAR